MKWRGRRGSRNIEDRRRMGGGKAVGGVGGVGLLAIVVAGWFFGIDLTPLLGLAGDGGAASDRPVTITDADERAAEFVSVTLADTEEVWTAVFRDQIGGNYDPPILVLFKDATQSPCGGASAASGPFYCPADEKAYIDTAFFTTLERQLGAGGDLAAAYVVAHEVAHHVQNELGILGQADRARATASQSQSNAISVRVELQADCYSGIWARQAEEQFGSLERGDIDEAINAAKQIGDDTLQRNAGRTVTPHTFTHGSAEQRQSWFIRGFESGDLRDCDTFGADQL